MLYVYGHTFNLLFVLFFVSMKFAKLKKKTEMKRRTSSMSWRNNWLNVRMKNSSTGTEEDKWECVLYATLSLDIFNHLLACARKRNSSIFFLSKGDSVRHIQSQTHVLILFMRASVCTNGKEREREKAKKVVRSIGRQWWAGTVEREAWAKRIEW